MKLRVLMGLLLSCGALAQSPSSPFIPTTPPPPTQPILQPTNPTVTPTGTPATMGALPAPRIGRDAGSTRVVLDLPEGASYTVAPSFTGLRVDVTGARATPGSARHVTAQVTEWRYTPTPSGVTVTLLTPFPLALDVGWAARELPATSGSGKRLVIDLGVNVRGGFVAAQGSASPPVLSQPSIPSQPPVSSPPVEPTPVIPIPQPGEPPVGVTPGTFLTSPRVGKTPGNTRVVLDLPAGASYTLAPGPTGLRVDVKGVTVIAKNETNVSAEVREWRYDPAPGGAVVMVRTPFPLTDRTGFRTLFLPPSDGSVFNRLVLDFSPAYADVTPPTPAESTLPAFPAPVRIVLDPGHGGTDPGAVGSVVEKHVALAVALRVREILTAAGAEVQMTRDTDTGLSSVKDTDLALRASLGTPPASMYVSVHVNAVPAVSAASGYGVETWWYPNNPGSRDLAAALQAHVTRVTGAHSRGVKSNALAVLRKSIVPAALVEIGFTSHPVDGQNLLSPNYLERVAIGIAWGVREYVMRAPGPLGTR